MTPPALAGLLSCYSEALDAAEALSRKRVVVTSHGKTRWTRPFTRRLRLSAWFVRYFTVRHISRNLGLIRQRYARRAALSPQGSSAMRAAMAAIDDLLNSLPQIRFPRTLIFALAAALLLLPRALSADVRGPQVSSLVDVIFGIVTLNYSALGEAVSFPPGSVVTTLVFTTSFSIAVVLALPAGGFRLKRLAFACPAAALELAEGSGWRPSRWPFEAGTGAYRLERELFGTLGIRHRVEIPVDLLYWGAVLSPFNVALLCLPVVGAAESGSLGELIVIEIGAFVAAGLVLCFSAGLPLWGALRRSRRREGRELSTPEFKRILLAPIAIAAPALVVLGLLAHPLFRNVNETLTVSSIQVQQRSVPLGAYLTRHAVANLRPSGMPSPRYRPVRECELPCGSCSAWSSRIALLSAGARTALLQFPAPSRGRLETRGNSTASRWRAALPGPTARSNCSGRQTPHLGKRGYRCQTTPGTTTYRPP